MKRRHTSRRGDGGQDLGQRVALVGASIPDKLLVHAPTANPRKPEADVIENLDAHAPVFDGASSPSCCCPSYFPSSTSSSSKHEHAAAWMGELREG